MGHYIKTQSITCHYCFNPNCPACHGDKNYRDRFGLPCHCGLENMTFDKPIDVLMAIETEPMPDGGLRVYMEEVKPSNS